MITFPAAFQAQLNKSTSAPAWLLRIQQDILEDEQTTETDWGNNSAESQVDYTSSPPDSGDVILAAAAVAQVGNDTYDSWQVLSSDSDFARKTVYCDIFNDSGGSPNVSISGGVKSGWCGSTTGQWVEFDFTADAITLTTATTYWLKVYGGSGTSTLNVAWQSFQQVTGSDKDVTTVRVFFKQLNFILDFNYVAYTNNSGGDAYANGQLDITGDETTTDKGDMRFEVHYGPTYLTPGYITTQNMDLGETPTVNGEWEFSDLQPASTSIVYTAWGSATGAFAGEETSIGTVADGDAITQLFRYYRVKATLSTTDTGCTPTVRSIRAVFSSYLTLSSNDDLGYEPSVKSIGSLGTTADTFKPSTIGQITIGLALTQQVSNFLYAKYPKNKTVEVLAGFRASGFAESDFVTYYKGRIEDWSIDSARIVTLTVKDFSRDWKVKVPLSWEDKTDDVVWAAQHPVDVMLDILQNHVNVRDSLIDSTSFSTVKTALSGWKVSRVITGEPVEAKKLIEELRVLCSCIFVPQPDGSISLKQFDSAEAAVVALTDDNVKSVKKWSANATSLINRLLVYYDWFGEGDDAVDFGALEIDLDTTSLANWRETATHELKDKWTLAAESAQITSLAGDISARYADPPPMVDLTADLKHMALEVGDIVTLTTPLAPSADLSGISAVKFQVIKRNLDFQGMTLGLTLLGVGS